MKIAVPVANGRLCMHFGHCDKFAIFEVDAENKTILEGKLINPPPHEPGVLPRFLSEQGADIIIAGGMGARAQDIFAQHGIKVLIGAPSGPPDEVVKNYLEGNLALGQNPCDH